MRRCRVGHPTGAVSWRGLGRTQGGCSLWHVQHADDKHRHRHTPSRGHTHAHTHTEAQAQRGTCSYTSVCAHSHGRSEICMWSCTHRQTHTFLNKYSDIHTLADEPSGKLTYADLPTLTGTRDLTSPGRVHVPTKLPPGLQQASEHSLQVFGRVNTR